MPADAPRPPLLQSTQVAKHRRGHEARGMPKGGALVVCIYTFSMRKGTCYRR